MMNKFWIGSVAAFLVAAALWWFFGVKLYDVGKVAGVREAKTWYMAHADSLSPARIDTVEVLKEVETIRIVKVPKHDTVTVTQVVGGVVHDDQVEVRSADAVLYMKTVQKDSAKVGDLFVKYFYPPVDRMQIDFKPVPYKKFMITKTIYVPQIQTVERKKRWHEKPWPWIATGVLIGATSVAAVK